MPYTAPMFDTTPSLDCNGHALRLDRPRVCGILNLTAASFSGDGLGADVDAAVARGVAIVVSHLTLKEMIDIAAYAGSRKF